LNVAFFGRSESRFISTFYKPHFHEK